MQTQSPLLEWAYEKLANLDRQRGVERTAIGKEPRKPTPHRPERGADRKTGGICDDLGKPSSAIEYWQNALKLKPSPQQRIRIRLALGEKLLEQARKAEAADNYKQLLAEAPDYPGKSQIEDKLKALEGDEAGARHAGKPAN